MSRSESRRQVAFTASLLFAAVAAFAHDSGRFTLDFRNAPSETLPWGTLAQVVVRREEGRLVPHFMPRLLAMANAPTVLYGYMTAPPGGGLQRRFLLSPRPIFCGECDPLAPEEIVEIVMAQPVPVADRPIAVRGKLMLLPKAPDGVLYRLEQAAVVARRPM